MGRPFNWGMKILRGCSENLYTSKPTGGGGTSKKIEPLAGGAAKISIFQFQYLHPPLLPHLVILNELPLTVNLLIAKGQQSWKKKKESLTCKAIKDHETTTKLLGQFLDRQ